MHCWTFTPFWQICPKSFPVHGWPLFILRRKMITPRSMTSYRLHSRGSHIYIIFTRKTFPSHVTVCIYQNKWSNMLNDIFFDLICLNKNPTFNKNNATTTIDRLGSLRHIYGDIAITVLIEKRQPQRCHLCYIERYLYITSVITSHFV